MIILSYERSLVSLLRRSTSRTHDFEFEKGKKWNFQVREGGTIKAFEQKGVGSYDCTGGGKGEKDDGN